MVWLERKGVGNTELYIMMPLYHLPVSLCYSGISTISPSWGIHQLVELLLLEQQKGLGCVCLVSTWVPY